MNVIIIQHLPGYLWLKLSDGLIVILKKMKTKIILISLLILALILISLKVFQSSDGPHGGRVKQAEEYHIEMKNPGGSLHAFLLDRNQKPLSNKDITCRAKLFYPDNTSSEADMAPFGWDGFLIESIPRYYVSCRIVFNVSGKHISAEFENETLFVNKK